MENMFRFSYCAFPYQYGKSRKHPERKNTVFNPNERKMFQDQCFFANRYYNKCMEIKKNGFEEYRALRVNNFPKLAKLEEEYEKASEVYKEFNDTFKNKPKDQRTKEEKAKSKKLSTARSAINAQLKQAREEFKQSYEPANAELSYRKLCATLQWLMDNPNDANKDSLNAVQHSLGLLHKYKEEFIIKSKDDEEDAEKHINKDVRAQMLELANKAGANNKSLKKIHNDILQTMLQESWPEVWKHNTQNSEKQHALLLQARAESNCFSGTYQATEDALASAIKKSKKDPKFKRYKGEGIVKVQLRNIKIQDFLDNKVSNAKIVFDDTFISKKGKKSAVVSLKLAGRAKSDEEWINVPVLLHRPLPEDARILWIELISKRLGTKMQYSLQFVLSSQQHNQRFKNYAKTGTAAVSIGWRSWKDGRYRVAVIYDGKNIQEVFLPRFIREREQQASDMSTALDLIGNSVRDSLKKWLKTNSIDERIHEELAARKYYLKNMHSWSGGKNLTLTTIAFGKAYLQNVDVISLWKKWKAHRKLQIAAPPNVVKRQWRKQVLQARTQEEKAKQDLFPEKPVIIDWFKSQGINDEHQLMALYLAWWLRKHSHLRDNISGLRRRNKNFRKNFYREVALDLRRKYNKVIIQKMDKADIAKKPKVEDDERTKQEEKANAVRQNCGVYVMVMQMKSVFGQTNSTEVEVIKPKHFHCGGEMSDKLPNTLVRCDKCGKGFDQDVNTAMHLFERSDATPPPASKKPTQKQKDVDEQRTIL